LRVATFYDLPDIPDWRADNGEIIGAPKESGGWLMLDKGYQDIAFYASFHCGSACQTGLLLRAEKTADGMKGIYVSLAGGDIGGYDVLLDAQGKETSRTPLGPGPGWRAWALPASAARRTWCQALRSWRPHGLRRWRQQRRQDLRRQPLAAPGEGLALH